MEPRQWRIGELAKATGLTVRALRHYEHEGLLEPSSRTAAGHRVYAERDVHRLYEILVLRRLGLGIAEIREQLTHPRDLRDVVREHAVAVRGQVAELERLLRRLQQVVESLERPGQPSHQVLLDVMERMTMLERYLSTGELARLRARQSELGHQAAVERYELLRDLRAAHEAGIEASDAHVRELASRMRALFQEYLGDPRIGGALARMVEAEGPEAATHGPVSTELMEYLQRALPA